MPTVSSYVRVLSRCEFEPEYRFFNTPAADLGAYSGELDARASRWPGPTQATEDHRGTIRTCLAYRYPNARNSETNPIFFLREDTNEQWNKPWLSIARRSLAITAADKVSILPPSTRACNNARPDGILLIHTWTDHHDPPPVHLPLFPITPIRPHQTHMSSRRNDDPA